MSGNIYEDLDLGMKVWYSKGAQANQQEKVERVVEIYNPLDIVPDFHGAPFTQDGRARTELRVQNTQRNSYKIVAIILGLLCLILLMGISVLLKLYLPLLSKQESNSTQIICPVGNDIQTQGNTTDGWLWLGVRKYCFYVSTEKKNWTESRKDCKRRGADLVTIISKEKHELVKKVKIYGDSWIGLEVVTIKWNNKWAWTDEKEITYRSWKAGEDERPEANYKAYTDLQGNWMKTTNGSKHWICEKTTC